MTYRDHLLSTVSRPAMVLAAHSAAWAEAARERCYPKATVIATTGTRWIGRA